MLGERRRFEQWVRRYHGDLYRHAYWLMGDPTLAEELVQETFYRAWRGRRGLRRRDEPFPWLLGILRHACFAELGRRGRQAAPLPEEPVEDASPELVDLQRALARLDPGQRDILLLHALHGMSYAEISEQLEIPLGTVMSRLSRARAALRRLWDAPDDTVIPFPGRRRR